MKIKLIPIDDYLNNSIVSFVFLRSSSKVRHFLSNICLVCCCSSSCCWWWQERCRSFIFHFVRCSVYIFSFKISTYKNVRGLFFISIKEWKRKYNMWRVKLDTMNKEVIGITRMVVVKYLKACCCRHTFLLILVFFLCLKNATHKSTSNTSFSLFSSLSFFSPFLLFLATRLVLILLHFYSF